MFLLLPIYLHLYCTGNINRIQCKKELPGILVHRANQYHYKGGVEEHLATRWCQTQFLFRICKQ